MYPKFIVISSLDLNEISFLNPEKNSAWLVLSLSNGNKCNINYPVNIFHLGVTPKSYFHVHGANVISWCMR